MTFYCYHRNINRTQHSANLTKRGNTDYSACTKSLKCDLTPEQLIQQTHAWDALSVSTTAAKKSLSAEQMQQFFSETLGSRRMKRVLPVAQVE